MGKKLLPHQVEFLKKIGKNIRKYRKQKKISQQELGYLCESEKQYISMVELGQKNITAIIVQRISEALEIPPSKIFEVD